MRLICFLIAFILSTNSTSFAGWGVDGNQLKKLCNSKNEDNYLGGYCSGFIAASSNKAIQDRYCKYSNWDNKGITKYLVTHDCKEKYLIKVPERMLLSQVVSIVKKYLDDHPVRLHEEAGKLVALALEDGFGFEEAPMSRADYYKNLLKDPEFLESLKDPELLESLNEEN